MTKVLKILFGSLFAVAVIALLAYVGWNAYKAVPAAKSVTAANDPGALRKALDAANEKLAAAEKAVRDATTKPRTDRSADETKPGTPSGGGFASGVTGECKAVKFTRPDIGSKKNFTVTFAGGDLATIKACNPQAEIDRTENGVRVAVVYGDGSGTISLPSTMVAGNAHTARCVANETGDIVGTALYKAQWQGGLPLSFDLALVDKAFYDSDAGLAKCRALMAARKVH